MAVVIFSAVAVLLPETKSLMAANKVVGFFATSVSLIAVSICCNGNQCQPMVCYDEDIQNNYKMTKKK